MIRHNTNHQVISGSIDNDKVSKLVRSVFDWGGSIFFAIPMCILFSVFFMNFTVIGESMLPTLHDNDRLVVFKFMYTPKKGDIVTIDESASLGKSIVKRVIATPGDTFKIDYAKGDLYINGKVINEPYINETTRVKGNVDFGNMVTVPAGHVVVLGDNRNHSTDSRFQTVGFVKTNLLYGKAVSITWPINRFRFFA